MIKHVPKRIVVFRIGQLGDTIIALPAFWALREHFPAAHMALLSDMHSGKGYISPEMVLPRGGLFDEYIQYEAIAEGANPKNLLPLISLLRRSKYDTLVYLYPRGRPRWRVWCDIVFFRLAGIRNFIGTRGLVPLLRPANGSPLPRVQHESDYLLNSLSLSGIHVPPPGLGSMCLELTAAEISDAYNWLDSRMHQGKSRPLIGIGPGSKMPAKVWPKERFEAVGKYFLNELGVLPIVFGGKEDRVLGGHLISQWGAGINAAGELNVREAAALLSLCRLYVGNDTGTMHLAAAVKIPCVAIFSARDWPGRWNPYGKNNVALRAEIDCEGCRLEVCTRNNECLNMISIASVIAASRQSINLHGNDIKNS